MARKTVAWSLLILIATGCPRANPARPATPAAPFENRYPDDISLPAGVEYPCAVTALPADLVGIPDEERNYVNHVYAALIDVVRAKQVLLFAFARPEDGSQTHADYVTATDEALTRLRSEAVPTGLEAFHEEVITSIELHRTYFEKLAAAKASATGPIDMHQFPEGHEASSRLRAAWGAMEGRYREWSPAVKDSIYHHLCALDLY